MNGTIEAYENDDDDETDFDLLKMKNYFSSSLMAWHYGM